MISFENVSRFVLSDVNIHVPEGKTVGLIGASGAGKTTFLKLACGLLAPSAGNVYTMGLRPALERKRFGRDLSVLFTDIPILQKEDTVVENFETLRRIYQISDKEFRTDYQNLAERLGFAGFDSQAVKELSLGQRRRVEIGAALIQKPRLLLMDEPTGGLDENAKQSFYELIKEREKEGLTILLTSHNMAEISNVCSRIALIDQGEILYYGTEERLKKRFAPIDTMVLELKGALPDIEDLPLTGYIVDENRLALSYNANYITAAEILKLILQQTVVKEMKIQKPDLADIILKLKAKKDGSL